MSQYTDVVQIDLSDVQEFGGGGGPQLDPGEYVFDIESAKSDTSKSQQPVWKVGFVVAEGEHAGKKMINSYSLQSQALGRVKQLALAIGADLSKLDAAQYVGARLRATVIHRTGDAQLGPDGNPLPARTFANIANERPYEDAAAQPAAPPPPVTRGAKNGAAPVRRA